MKTDTCGQGLISKTTMHVHQTFLYISLTSLHECDVKFSQVTFYDVDVTFFITPIIRYPPKRLHFLMCLKFICQNVTRVSIKSSEKQLQVSLKWNILFSSNIHKNKKNKTVVTSTVNPLLSPPPLPSQISPPFFRGKKVHKPPTLLRPHSPPLFTFYCQMLNCINQWQR